MSSFYGGKQGRTYHIVARYDCVYLDPSKYYTLEQLEQQEEEIIEVGTIYKESGNFYKITSLEPFESVEITGMLNKFQTGGQYVEANYGQYVLIDTVLNSGRSNQENGLLYRRGFDFNEPIVQRPDPSDLEYQIEDNFDEEKYQIAWREWVQNPGAGAIYVGQIVGSEGKVPKIKVKDWDVFISQIENREGYGGHSTVSMNNPGLVITENQGNFTYKYNDQIDLGYINIIDSNGDIIDAYLAFDIPTPVFNITAQSVSPYEGASTQYDITGTLPSSYTINRNYDSNTHQWKYDNLIHIQPNSTAHSFFHKYDISIPNGIHGQDVEDIKVESYNASSSSFTPITTVPLADGDQYFTYTIKNYNANSSGESTQHLGCWPYRVINTITASTINRSILPSNIWNSESPIQVQTGQMIDINPSSTNLYHPYLICIKSGLISSESLIQMYDFENEEIIGSEYQDNEVKWLYTTLPKTSFNSLIVDYKAGQSDTISFRQIDHIYVDSTGYLWCVYSDDLNTQYFITQVDSIKSIDQEDGLITITNKSGIVTKIGLKQVDKIKISQNITQDQDIIITYKEYNKSEDEVQEIKETLGTLNNILDIQRVGDNILILYSDPRIRNAIPKNKRYRKNWTSYKVTYEEVISFQDIKDSLNSRDDFADFALEYSNSSYYVYFNNQYISAFQYFENEIDFQNQTLNELKEKLLNDNIIFYNANNIEGNTYQNLIWYNFGQLGAQYHVAGIYDYRDILPGFNNVEFPVGSGHYGSTLVNGFGTNQDEDRMGWILSIPVEEQDEETHQIKIVQKVYAYDYNSSNNHHIQYNNETYTTNWYEITSLADAVTPPDSHMIVSQDVEEEEQENHIYHTRDNLKTDGIWFVVSGGHD